MDLYIIKINIIIDTIEQKIRNKLICELLWFQDREIYSERLQNDVLINQIEIPNDKLSDRNKQRHQTGRRKRQAYRPIHRIIGS